MIHKADMCSSKSVNGTSLPKIWYPLSSTAKTIATCFWTQVFIISILSFSYPLVKFMGFDDECCGLAVKVLVFLTMPIEPTSTDISQQLEYLWEIKSSITSSDVVAVIVSFLEGPLENLERWEEIAYYLPFLLSMIGNERKRNWISTPVNLSFFFMGIVTVMHSRRMTGN